MIKYIMKGDNNLEYNKGIYRIKNNVTDKVYIGSSNNFVNRRANHISKLNKKTHHNTVLQKEWDYYKEKSFSIELIEHIEDESLLPKIEKQYIDIYKSYRGVYNVSDPTKEIASSSRYFNLRKKFNKHNVRDKNTYTYTEKYILNYLNDKYKEFIKLMKINIRDKTYFNKNKVDDWIIKRIDDECIIKDSRLYMIIDKFYNSNGFKPVNAFAYKMHIEYLCDIKIKEENEEILINLTTWKNVRKRKEEILNMKRDVV